MTPVQRYTRAGMTLVELLVVVAILGLLSVAVLPNLAGREGSRAVRLAASNASAQFAKSQSSAIARKKMVGIWLNPLPNNSAACIDLYFADVPDSYRGDTFNAKFTVSPTASTFLSGTLTSVPIGSAASLGSPGFGNFANPGNLIQFNDVGPFFDFCLIGGSWIASLRSTSSQTPANTLWPAPAPAAHRFAIHRLPTRAGQPLTLPVGAAIDVAWSGVGSQRFGTGILLGDGNTTPGNANDDWLIDPDYAAAINPPATASPATIIALFDAAGSFAEMCYVANSPTPATTTRFSVQGPLYLLVGRVDRCGLPYNPAPTDSSPGANWQYPDSFWIAIDPRTGVIKTAEVSPNSVTARASQAFIRAGLATAKL
jgi:prepilin-type N-terminal cleavage/methylation domain-containing protein